jgi:hypothetical protein
MQKTTLILVAALMLEVIAAAPLCAQSAYRHGL